MNRYKYSATQKRIPGRTYACLLSWQTWSEFCDFVDKPIFKTGTYLGDNNVPQPMPNSNDWMGVILADGPKEYLLKQGEILFYCDGCYRFREGWSGEWIDIRE